ncbi:MAG TPA: carboxypeptidase-like regulatory domain-containing protein [Planctomycetaceae bacterium]|jgi:hypothetical protein
MSLVELWHRATRRTRNDELSEQNGDVNDELMFHFRELVNEKLAEGLSFDAAWDWAEQQFGPMRRYEDECRTAQVVASNKRRYFVGAVLVMIVAWAAWSLEEHSRSASRDDVRLLRDEVDALRQKQAARNAEANTNGPVLRIPGGFDLTGAVFDNDGRPLPQATVLIIRKTWPGGGYRQEAFTATTNDEGRFAFPEFVPADDQYGIQVAALKEGFAFQSAYQLKDRKPIEKPEPIALRLQRASSVTLVVQDATGEPIANARVIPSARKSRDGAGHLVYFHGSEPVQCTTDAAGRVNLNCFMPGDQAEIFLQLPGDKWNSREFEVSNDNQVVELAASGIGGE